MGICVGVVGQQAINHRRNAEPLTIAREMKAHVDAAQPLPRLWYMAVMNNGIAAPDPERMTVFAARAEATYPGNASMRYALAEK